MARIYPLRCLYWYCFFLFYLVICYFAPRPCQWENLFRSNVHGLDSYAQIDIQNGINGLEKWRSGRSARWKIYECRANFTFWGPEFGKGMVYLDEVQRLRPGIVHPAITVGRVKWPPADDPGKQDIIDVETPTLRLQQNIPFLKRPVL